MRDLDKIIRPHAEDIYSEELKMLSELDTKPRPANWKLSPWAVLTYILGGKLNNGFEIETKYFGNRRLIEIAVSTLATDQALLLMGIPGTAKTWVSEHLAAAISGNSSFLIQGTAGLIEDSLRYTWNYAKLLTEGPSESALVPSPVLTGMMQGKIVRIEELTRLPSDVQDSLITILSEKTLPVPELSIEIQAIKGFNVIATANERDRGINEISSALRRRFNTVIMPLPETLEEEINIVKKRIEAGFNEIKVAEATVPVKEIQRLVQIFRELRSGKTEDGKAKVKSPSSTLSTAEAISVLNNSIALAVHFGSGVMSARDIATGITGAIIKNQNHDQPVWQEYLETIIKERSGWKDLYEAFKEAKL
jgi:MoxR-like ATPase